jgi:hypothetical protein
VGGDISGNAEYLRKYTLDTNIKEKAYGSN